MVCFASRHQDLIQENIFFIIAKSYTFIFNLIPGTEKRSCELQRRLLLSTNQTETFVPSCDLHGYYSTIQCEVSSDECWCSDREGNEILGSRTKETPECGNLT